MIVQFRKSITSLKADELIAKYYEGKTTNNEEKLLHAFLSQKGLDNKYQVEKDILEYFIGAKQNTHHKYNFPLIYRIVAAAVVVFFVGYSVTNFIYRNEDFAYVDGHRISDKKNIESLANNSLQDISAENNNVMEEQLTQFSNQ